MEAWRNGVNQMDLWDMPAVLLLLIALPVLGRVASLNVSAAAAAILYQILQSRRRG